MKFLVSVFVIAILAVGVFSYSKRKWVTVLVVLALLECLGLLMYSADTAPDTQCTTVHKATSKPPARLNTAMDYFQQGNYDYDIGNCVMAIADYTKSIKRDSEYPQAYNNRAYTYMRIRDYRHALTDLDKALALNPNYIPALMNRGDIHNYYFAIDRQRAVSDYEKVIALGGTSEPSVCGHLFLAEHNGWNIGTILDIPKIVVRNCY